MNLIRTLLTIIGIFIILGIGTLSCEQVDKALETVDKTKNLSSEMEKKAGEFKKNVEQSAEDIAGRLKKGTDNRGTSGREDKRSEDENRTEDERSKHAKDREKDDRD
jgi:hypothetical protein